MSGQEPAIFETLRVQSLEFERIVQGLSDGSMLHAKSSNNRRKESAVVLVHEDDGELVENTTMSLRLSNFSKIDMRRIKTNRKVMCV